MFTLSHAPPRLSYAGTFQRSGGLAKSPPRLFHSLSVGSPPLKVLIFPELFSIDDIVSDQVFQLKEAEFVCDVQISVGA